MSHFTKKLSYSVLLAVLVSSVAFAQVNQSKPVFQNNNFDGVSRVFESGKEFCEFMHDQHMGLKTCIPFNSSASIELDYVIKTDNPKDKEKTVTVAKGALVPLVLDNKKKIKSIHIIVTTHSPKEEIFDGMAKNRIGIDCSETSCGPWKDN